MQGDVEVMGDGDMATSRERGEKRGRKAAEYGAYSRFIHIRREGDRKRDKLECRSLVFDMRYN